MPIYKCKRSQPTSLKSPALAGEFFTTKATWEAYIYIYIYIHTHIYIKPILK